MVEFLGIKKDGLIQKRKELNLPYDFYIDFKRILGSQIL